MFLLTLLSESNNRLPHLSGELFWPIRPKVYRPLPMLQEVGREWSEDAPARSPE